jgi:hypothetical protein
MLDAAPRARSGNLTAGLVVIATLELVLNRLANRLFLPQSSGSGDSFGAKGAALVAASGPLLFHLTGVLALIVLLGAVGGLLRRGELFPRGMRVAVGLIWLFFCALAALSLVAGGIPAWLFMHARISFAFLFLFVAAGALAGPTRRRVRLGVGLFALPGVLTVAAIFVDRTSVGAGSEAAALLARARDVAALASGLGAPFLLPPRPAAERPWRRPLAVALGATFAFTLLFVRRFDLLQAALLYGVRMELPPATSAFGVAAIAAFFCWTFATLQLLVDRGGMRLAGYGLLLLAAAGTQPASPVELSLGLVGLLALAVGEERAAPYGEPSRARVDGAAWRAYVGRLATAAGDGSSPDDSRSEGVVVEEGELEVSRIRAHRRGLLVAMRLLRRRGALVELEATVGEPARGGPDASIERHRSWLARGPEQRVRLPRARTGDPDFDRRFSVHGDAPLADAGLRGRLARHLGDGVVSLWRGAAARYQVRGGASAEDAPPFSGDLAGEAPVGNVVAVLDTLGDLVEGSSA